MVRTLTEADKAAQAAYTRQFQAGVVAQSLLTQGYVTTPEEAQQLVRKHTDPWNTWLRGGTRALLQPPSDPMTSNTAHIAKTTPEGECTMSSPEVEIRKRLDANDVNGLQALFERDPHCYNVYRALTLREPVPERAVEKAGWDPRRVGESALDCVRRLAQERVSKGQGRQDLHEAMSDIWREFPTLYAAHRGETYVR
jgi:hypothetical protein